MWFAYALRSLSDGWFYIGMTSRLDERVKEHNAGYNRSTRTRVPFDLVYAERFDSRLAARAREKYLKSGIGREYLRSVAADSIKLEMKIERG
jgi:putative endonuclease